MKQSDRESTNIYLCRCEHANTGRIPLRRKKRIGKRVWKKSCGVWYSNLILFLFWLSVSFPLVRAWSIPRGSNRRMEPDADLYLEYCFGVYSLFHGAIGEGIAEDGTRERPRGRGWVTDEKRRRGEIAVQRQLALRIRFPECARDSNRYYIFTGSYRLSYSTHWKNVLRMEKA